MQLNITRAPLEYADGTRYVWLTTFTEPVPGDGIYPIEYQMVFCSDSSEYYCNTHHFWENKTCA